MLLLQQGPGGDLHKLAVARWLLKLAAREWCHFAGNWISRTFSALGFLKFLLLPGQKRPQSQKLLFKKTQFCQFLRHLPERWLLCGVFPTPQVAPRCLCKNPALACCVPQVARLGHLWAKFDKLFLSPTWNRPKRASRRTAKLRYSRS